MNSTMFFLVSFFSGLLFYEVGGVVGSMGLESLIIPIFFYQVASVLINQILLFSYLKYIAKASIPFYSKDFIWDGISNLIMMPIALSFYYLTFQIGGYASLLIGVPFISLVIIMKLYNSSEKINLYLQKAGEIGHQLTERLKVSEVLDIFIEKITSTLPVEYAYILDCYDPDLVLIRRVENGRRMPNDLPHLKKGEGISGRVWESGESMLFTSKKEWEDIAEGYMPEEVESVLCVPIVRNQKVRGILLLATSKKKAYEKMQLMIVDILCSYFGVAMENARHHEMTKHNSERCALTDLYNYRYFEDLLALEFNYLESGQRRCLSLIMLDLDHFKAINDTYGHQGGNEILKGLSTRLVDMIGAAGTVARYGGEEFVILLPDIENRQALQVAEKVRQRIADTPFLLHDSLNGQDRRKMVRITASIGVATAPVDADDPLALIRHADRALYTGAKQLGRNRVAQYVK
ncbi:sensor domain-containing diguanylate cyclase [Rossellomorea marisflavi]|uniref:sensor domain-containing diguanylate cyclase n=1 Tax=Rossellomorea marisflavi TaxID=189381 RepID=UPI001E49823D|nr:sensor domain-containing diguanylate cyclase [Rossellomorea marisflavi]